MNKSKVLRRSFLQTVATTAMASSASAQEEPLRFGMIGVGKRGNAHLRRFVKRSDVAVKAVCDIDPSARDAAQSG